MHWSIAVLTFLGLTSSAVASNDKREAKQFEPCTNFGEEWCSDGEILTCHQAASTGYGWAKSIHKTCTTKREVGKSDKCFNYGQEWCSDGEILTCKKIMDADQGRAMSTNKQCTVEKRGVGSWCHDDGATWCEDYKMLHCENHRIAHTGAGCDNSHNRPGDGTPDPANDPGSHEGAPWTNTTMKHRPHSGPHKNETQGGNEKRHGPWWQHPRPHKNETEAAPEKRIVDEAFDRPWWKPNGTHPGPGPEKHRPHGNGTHGYEQENDDEHHGQEKRHGDGRPWWQHPRPHKNETEAAPEKRHGGEFGPPWWKHNSTHPGPDKHRPHKNGTHGHDQENDDDYHGQEKRHGDGRPWWQHPRPHKNETEAAPEKRHGGNGEFGLPWWKHNDTYPGPQKGGRPSWNGTHEHGQDQQYQHDIEHNEHERRDHGHEWGPLGDDGSK